MIEARVLIVEDESIIADDISRSLEQVGYSVVAKETTGAGAINAAHEHRPDIAIMDVELRGEMDGIEAASRIHSSLNIPVVFLTAYAEERMLERAMLTNAYGYLIKPFEGRELHFALQSALSKFKAEEDLKRVTRALRTLSSSNNALVRATDERELLEQVCRIIVEEGGYTLAWVGIAEGNGGALGLAASAGKGSEDRRSKLSALLETADNLMVTSMKTAMPISMQDISAYAGHDALSAGLADSGFGACIALPFLSEEGARLGVICICTSDPKAFDPDEFDLLVDLANNIAYWIMSVRNRAAHREVEAALLSSHERFLAVMDSLDAIVYVADMDTHEVLFANKYVRDNFSFEAGRPCWRIFQGDDAGGPCGFCTNKHLLDLESRPKGVHQWEYKNPVNGKWYDGRDRAIHWVDGRTVRLEIATDITRRVNIEEELEKHREHLADLVEERTADLRKANIKLHQEMKERKRAEQDLLKAQKLESMGVLAGGIAHDFNNILTSILNNISLARIYSSRDENQHKKLVAAEKATLRARDLTQKLLTFSKSGMPVKKTASIAELIRDSADFVLMGSNVKIDYSIPSALWPVEVDEAQISQVVSNVVINAGQAMPGGGMIWIRLQNVTVEDGDVPPLKAGRYLRMSIKDEGVGIHKENIGRIFDPYFTTKKGGSGLGLASTYFIIKNHDGHISVESESGEGTTFNIYLPASDEPLKKEPAEASASAITGIGRVLVMDDDPDIRESIGDVLEFLGYEAAFAEGGEEAIKLYSNAAREVRPFDAVIMDLTIPGGMGGIEALSILKMIDPAVKAVVSSGYSNDLIMSDYRRYGFKGMITKPYKVEDLSQVMHKVINGHE